MIMLIYWEGTVIQTRIGVGRVTFASKRLMMGTMAFLWQNSKAFIHIIFSVVISGDSAFYYIG